MTVDKSCIQPKGFSDAACHDIPAQGDETFRLLVLEQLPFMEKQCRKACGLSRARQGGFLDPDQLYNELLEKLTENNFQVIREFRGSAKITTYITAIISNLVVDLVRKHRGRSRAHERAQQFGDVGEQLYDLVFVRGYSCDEACESLRTTFNFTGTSAELHAMLKVIQGHQQIHDSGSGTVWRGIALNAFQNEDGSIVIPDSAADPEEACSRRQRGAKASEVMASVMAGLSGEDKLLLVLRYPVEEDQAAKELSEIAAVCNCTPKAADSRIRRILSRCREAMLGQGVRLEDFVL